MTRAVNPSNEDVDERVAWRPGPRLHAAEGENAQMPSSLCPVDRRSVVPNLHTPPRGDGARDARNNEHHVCARRRDGEAAGSERGFTRCNSGATVTRGGSRDRTRSPQLDQQGWPLKGQGLKRNRSKSMISG